MITHASTFQGIRFRSALAACWAYNLTNWDVTWIYETRDYRLSEADRYVPDFWLPELETWLGIRTDDYSVHQFTQFMHHRYGAFIMRPMPIGFVLGHALEAAGPAYQQACRQCSCLLELSAHCPGCRRKVRPLFLANSLDVMP